MLELRYHLTPASNNAKVGPIPVSTSPRQTCPDSCDFKRNGCYAENFPLSLHWNRLSEGVKGVPWEQFVGQVAALGKGQLWRHNQAGDLPGQGDKIDAKALRQLVKANAGKRGFTYTHYPMTAANQRAVVRAVDDGFTINLSADTPAQADELYALNVAPVVCVVPAKDPPRTTPAGRKIIVCPAQVKDDVTCATCQLCQRADRTVVIGFLAHGGRRAAVERVIKLKEERT